MFNGKNYYTVRRTRSSDEVELYALAQYAWVSNLGDKKEDSMMLPSTSRSHDFPYHPHLSGSAG